MTELNIYQGYYRSKSPIVSDQACINWYVNAPEVETLSEKNLFGTPGYPLLATTGILQQVNRGAWSKGGIAYFVNGDQLYSLDQTIDADGVDTYDTTALGTIEGSGRVSMASNNTQLMILVPGGKGYIYNEGDGTPFQEITDSNFYAVGNPLTVIFIDTYFACTTDNFRWTTSSVNDGLVWSALNFGSAESDPDEIVSSAVINNQLFILGSLTGEGFENIGGYGFPFQRSGVFLSRGCSAPFSVVNSGEIFYMLGRGENEHPSFFMFNGEELERVASVSVDNKLSEYTLAELESVFGYAYAKDGAYFIAFTLPDTTLVFNQMTGLWHEHSSLINDEATRCRVNSLTSAYGKLLVGDSVDGRIGEVDFDHYYEYGEPIIRTLRPKPFSNGGKPVLMPMIELTMQAGVGNDDCPNPKVSLAIARDGENFDNTYQRLRSIGKKGERKRRTIWRKNGRAARFVNFEIIVSDPVKAVIVKLEAA